MNEAYEIVAKHLQQQFVPLCDWRLAADSVAKLTLHSGERRFDVGASMVARQKFLAIQHEVVERLVPDSRRAVSVGSFLERYVGRSAEPSDRSEVFAAQIALIGAD